MRTSGLRSTEVYEPAQWLVSPVGGDQTTEPAPDVYKDTLAFIEQRIRRSPKGYVIKLDDGEVMYLEQYLGSNDFWRRWDLSTPDKLEGGMSEIRSILDRFITQTDTATQAVNERPSLFDDDFMEQAQGSMTGLSVAEAPHGAFVTLAARASSITAIMDAYSAANSARHIKSENDDSGSAFKRHYDSEQKGLANRVARGMGHNANRLLGTIGAHLNILNDSAGMLRAGFSMAQVQDVRGDMKDELSAEFSEPGPDVVKRRHQQIAQVVKTAELARRAQKNKVTP